MICVPQGEYYSQKLTPQSLQSQIDRNQKIAKKLRLEREKQKRIYNNSQLDNITNEESYQSQGKQRSHTIQLDPHFIMNTKNQLTEIIEKSQELPLISQMINHIANRVKLGQHHKSFQIEELKLLQKQALFRLYI